MESLKRKNALVTDAGKGIGRAVAISLANESVNVGLLSRTESDLQEVARFKCRKKYQHRTIL